MVTFIQKDKSLKTSISEAELKKMYDVSYDELGGDNEATKKW